MDYEKDDLKFEYLAGGNILDYPPIFSSNGEYLLVMNKNSIKVYSTISCQFVRQLEGSTAPLIDFEFELGNEDILVACNDIGEIFSWQWKTGLLKNTLHLSISKNKQILVTNFNLLNLYGKSNLSHAFICYKITNESIHCKLVNREKGFVKDLPANIHSKMKKPLIAVDNKNFPTLVLAQGYYVNFVNYENWSYVRYKSAFKQPITVVKVHPTEECVATGDETGKIFLWREFRNRKTVKNSLYHWHHTKVTSICFTVAGANFYSSGKESVMVKWHIERPDLRQFIPRTPAEIRHLVVSPDNTKVVACLIDNSIQFYGVECKLLKNLQEFTYITDDNTESYKFPAGLRLNPRNNSLVLNGRIGSLQFYNTYTKSLLYNVNITNENLLSKEKSVILYDNSVTKAAFNIDWMATGEVFNDQEHLPELRLKFWKYQEETQNYALNTNIELPHEGGFKAIEFSNYYQVENLLCATVGEDNIIKMWSLDDSDNIYKKGKTWYCIAQTSYKELPVDAISFSQDGSLLAAGYGNTLCIYKSDNLKIKATLTGSNGIDGCLRKAQIRVPTKSNNEAKLEFKEKRKNLMQLFANMLETNEECLIKELQNTVHDKDALNKNICEPSAQLNDEQKLSLYKKILQIHELNLFQKVLLYQKLGIACKIHPQMEKKLEEYLCKLIEKGKMERMLNRQTFRLNLRQRFKARYRFLRYKKYKCHYQNHSKNLVSLLSIMSLGKTHNLKNKDYDNTKKHENEATNTNIVEFATPEATMAKISHVQFAAGEYAHLVIVCTEHRILIWNLLTLRLQAVLKLSVKHLTFDPQTNLVAVVTYNNELHLFQPNVPLPIYQRQNLPNLHGIAWIPRRYPQQRSINLNWQAQSTLYFLTKDQTIIYLHSPKEKESDVPAPVIFQNMATDSIQYTTFGTYATKSVSDKSTVTRQNGGPLIVGNNEKATVKALIDMSVHTMPSMSLICEDFVKSMVKRNNTKHQNSEVNTENADDALTTRLNGEMNGYGSHTDDEDENGDTKAQMTNGFSPSSSGQHTQKIRKDLMSKTESLKSKQKSAIGTAGYEAEERILRSMVKQFINLDF